MKLLLKLSLRNLVRQKKRNIFLGISIGFGMMILVIATSFSNGMVDVLFNDVVTYVSGHLVVKGMSGSTLNRFLISDRFMVEEIINQSIDDKDLVSIDEELFAYVRAVGNNTIEDVNIVGVNFKTEEQQQLFNEYFTIINGNFDNFLSEDINYPVIISAQKAKALNVSVNDSIRVRLPMVTGQIQAVALTVVAIARPNNTFMDIAVFLDNEKARDLFGYQSWESASLQIFLRDPKVNAKKYADILHENLKPGLISIKGNIANDQVQLLAYNNDAKSKDTLLSNINIISGDVETALSEKGVLLSKDVADKLNLNVGDEFYYSYDSKYSGEHQESFTLNAIYDSDTELAKDVLLVNGEGIFNTYYRFVPKEDYWNYIEEDSSMYNALAKEWKLLERSSNNQELQQKYIEESRIKTNQKRIDVSTMYEGASSILTIEEVLNLITMIVILILFLIILIGVINTLRMSIKERTPEIGTIRAIGLQKNDVKKIFVLETLFLTLISSIAGILLAIIVLQILGGLEFELNNFLSMILKNKRLNFIIDLKQIITNLMLILFISGITAYFPAKYAAKLPVVEALRN